MRPDYSGRLSRLRNVIAKKKLNGAFLNSYRDIFYYTGHEFSGDDLAFLLVTKKSSVLYVSTLSNDLAGPGVRVLSDFGIMKKDIKAAGKLGFDDKNLSVLLHNKLSVPGWKPFSQKLKSVRMVKDNHEISQLKAAAKETLKIFNALKPEGRTEIDVLSDIHIRIRKAGFSPSFDPIVASGKHSAFIHTKPGMRRITKGLVIVDMGLRRNGYPSDMTRMFCYGLNLREEKLLQETREMQTELIEMAIPGTKFSDIQKRYEKFLKGFGCPVMQGFGHGIGLSVHERPGRDDVLESGMVLTVEPGIYKKGVGGSRIEDMVLVSDKPRVLSR